MWTYKSEDKPKNLSIADQLREEAKEERRIANQMKGCTFVGEPPSSVHSRKANLLEIAANIIDSQKKS